jgi:hypothetical protein
MLVSKKVFLTQTVLSRGWGDLHRWERIDDGRPLHGDSMSCAHGAESTRRGKITASTEYKTNLTKLRALLHDLETGRNVIET